MTSLINPKLTQALRRAAVRATLAPSIHNTQPWRFVLRGDALEIHADWSRQLRVIDPRGRQLLISCGCAVFNARVSLAAAGYDANVERLADPARPNMVARLTVPDRPGNWLPIGELYMAIEQRRTNRRRFADEAVPPEVVYDLVRAASLEGAELFAITSREHRRAVARLSQQADQLENADPAYRAELRAWTTDDSRRLDGVPAAVVPHVEAGAGDDLPIRDFDTRGTGWLPTGTHSTLNQFLLLLGTMEDGPAAWLRGGEALERVLLEVADRGYAASPLTQVIEVAQTHAQLRQELQLDMNPNVLLRVGRAPTTPNTRRRRLVDVLTEAE